MCPFSDWLCDALGTALCLIGYFILRKTSYWLDYRLAAVILLALLVAVACGAALPFPGGPAPGPVPKETLKGEESGYYPLVYSYPLAYSYYPVAYWG